MKKNFHAHRPCGNTGRCQSVCAIFAGLGGYRGAQNQSAMLEIEELNNLSMNLSINSVSIEMNF